MRDLTVISFEHLYIISNLGLDISNKYTDCILHISALKNIDRSCWCARRCQWNIGEANNFTMEQLWNWTKADVWNSGRDYISGENWCQDCEKELRFELGNIMWMKHRSVFQYHAKYIYNEVLKPYRVGILQYSKRICGMHDLSQIIPPPSKKWNEYDQAYWNVCGEEWSKNDICIATRYKVPTFMQDKMENKDKDYRYLPQI